MCEINLDPCDVWKVSRPKARKAHRCAACGGTIAPGTQYVRLFTLFDGEARDDASCAECWADNEAFGNADGHTMTAPGYFPELLRECVEWTEDDDGNEVATGEWAPMLARLEARRDAARGGAK